MLEQLESRRFLSASVANGVLTVTGTDNADRIIITQQKKAVFVREGTHVTRFDQLSRVTHVNQITVNALGGNDRVTIVSKIGATVDGGEGRDLIIGGAGNDVLLGGNGNDRILGQRGNDSVGGGAGKDALFGGGGDDMIDAYDIEADQVAGGAGNDSARVDSQTDTAWNIENYLTLSTAASGSIGDSVDVLNNLTLSGNSTLNINAASGFTVGTYRLFTMTNFTDPGQIVIGANNGSDAFNYSIVETVPAGSGTIQLTNVSGATIDLSGATIHVNAGKLNLDTPNGGTGSIATTVLAGSTERGQTIAIDSDGSLVKIGAGTLDLNGDNFNLSQGITGFIADSDGSRVLIWWPIDRLTLANLIQPLPQAPETDPLVIAAPEETVVAETLADSPATTEAPASETVAEEPPGTEPIAEAV